MASFDPVPVKIGGKDFLMPGLSLKSVRILLESGMFEKASKGAATMDGLTAIVEFIYSALVRSYPDVTKEWLEENIGVGEAPDLMLAVFKASGFTKGSESGEAQP